MLPITQRTKAYSFSVIFAVMIQRWYPFHKVQLDVMLSLSMSNDAGVVAGCLGAAFNRTNKRINAMVHAKMGLKFVHVTESWQTPVWAKLV